MANVDEEFDLKVEFAVQVKCDSFRERIQKELSGLPGVQIDTIDVDQQRLVLRLRGDRGALEMQQLLEERLQTNAIIRGAGNFVAAVAQIAGSACHIQTVGVARFVQNDKRQCLVDAVVDGLSPGATYHLGIHQYGDLSDPEFESIGEEIRPVQHSVTASESGRLTVKTKIEDFDLAAAIGQSLAIRTGDAVMVGAGIVARASKIMDNVKRVCACSGKTLWQERESNRI